VAATTSPDVAPLVTVLSKEQAIYQQLLAVAADERQAIVDGKLPELKVALQRKQDILERLAALEDRRIKWLNRYASKRQLPLDTMTLASIIEGSQETDRPILTRLHRGLRRRIDRLVEMNAVTKTLLESILGSIDVSLRFLLTDDTQGSTYGAQGRLRTTAVLNRQLLECKA
jgi:flagellar biosynthesis/type III secretory pathway chaperone